MQFVVRVSIDGNFVLEPSEWTDVPRYVVAPTLHRFTDNGRL